MADKQKPRNMTLNKEDIESILKHVYDADDFSWEGNTVSMRISHVRILDKVKFHDSVKSGSFAGT